MHIVPIILVQTSRIPRAGDARLMPRVTDAQRVLINEAAKRLGMTQGEFMRVMLVNGAEYVISETGGQQSGPVV